MYILVNVRLEKARQTQSCPTFAKLAQARHDGGGRACRFGF
jgi:hypothetical protein